MLLCIHHQRSINAHFQTSSRLLTEAPRLHLTVQRYMRAPSRRTHLLPPYSVAPALHSSCFTLHTKMAFAMQTRSAAVARSSVRAQVCIFVLNTITQCVLSQQSLQHCWRT
jgi:hypothetical protein